MRFILPNVFCYLVCDEMKKGLQSDVLRGKEYDGASILLTTTSIIILPFPPANPLAPAEYMSCVTTALDEACHTML